MMEQKSNYFLLLFLCATLGFSQGTVGVNTTEPTKDLDVNGEVRIRTLNDQTALIPDILTADEDGNVFRSRLYRLWELESKVASSRVAHKIPLNSDYYKDDVDLGLSTDVTIPAGKEAIVIINYSVPIGFELNDQVGGNRYYGIRFFKNGTEVLAGTRKVAASSLYYYDYPQDSWNANMTSVSNEYIEKVDNTNNSNDLTITYSLQGFLEKDGTLDRPTFIFNMWAENDVEPNYNWGKGTILQTVYVK